MYVQFFHVLLSQPTVILSYNKEKEWWEGDIHLGRIATWLEIDKEQKRVYYNCFTLTDTGELKSRCKGVHGVLFTERDHALFSRSDENRERVYFDFSIDADDDRFSWENVYCYPVLFYSIFYKEPAWCIPEREELFQYTPPEPTLETQLSIEQWDKDFAIKESQKLQQAQERKEQAEKEWEEWEKRQAEENGDKE